MKRKLSVVIAAAAFSVVGASSLSYAADAAKDAAKEQKLAAEREKKAEKRELAEFKKFPEKVRTALEKEVAGAKNPDYYHLKEGDTRLYGAIFQDPQGEMIDVRVDKEGKVLSRLHSDVAHIAPAAAAAPATAAPATATPAPAAPVAPATAAPAAPAADARRDPAALTLAEIPAPAKAVAEQQIKGAHDIHYYRAKFGTQDVYEVKYTTADDKDMAVRIDKDGKIVDSRQLNKEEVAARKDPNVLMFSDLPKPVQTAMEKQTKGGKDVKYYRAKLGTQDVYEVKCESSNGKDMAVRVDSTGKVVDSKELPAKPATPAPAKK